MFNAMKRSLLFWVCISSLSGNKSMTRLIYFVTNFKMLFCKIVYPIVSVLYLCINFYHLISVFLLPPLYSKFIQSVVFQALVFLTIKIQSFLSKITIVNPLFGCWITWWLLLTFPLLMKSLFPLNKFNFMISQFCLSFSYFNSSTILSKYKWKI